MRPTASRKAVIPDVKRVTRTGPAPDHKPSILQDYELGRAMEIDVLVRAPAAFARAAGLSTPMLDMMAALAIRQARDKGLYSRVETPEAKQTDRKGNFNMHVKGKVCVVTGAASGIGEAVARAYAEAGARGVVVADLKTSRDRLAAVAGDIDGLAVTADVGLEEDIKALIAAAEDKFGPVDVFFSNAGLSRKGQESASDADWDVSWRVHVMSHVFAARAGARHARARLGLSAQHRVRRGPFGLAEFDALWRHEKRGDSARRASRHSIWRPRHPRFRAVPAIGADRDDDARAQVRHGSTACCSRLTSPAW